jgi:KDO2-lipid IV(A) lauroyltransferase
MGTTVLWVDKKSLLKDMLQVLKDGGALGFVMDQKPLARRGPLVTFFSQETPFVSGPASLAIRQGSPLLCVFCLRTGPFSYRLFWEIALRADHNQSDETQVTGILSTEIEKYIRLYPEQWTWNYRRWRWTEKSGGTPQKSH